MIRIRKSTAAAAATLAALAAFAVPGFATTNHSGYLASDHAGFAIGDHPGFLASDHNAVLSKVLHESSAADLKRVHQVGKAPSAYPDMMLPGAGQRANSWAPGTAMPGMLMPEMLSPGLAMHRMMMQQMMTPVAMTPEMMVPGKITPGMMGSGQGFGMDLTAILPGSGFGLDFGTSMGPAAGLDKDLSAEDVRLRLEGSLAWYGNKRLEVGDVTEADADSIIADIVTKDGSLVQRYLVDRRTGRLQGIE